MSNGSEVLIFFFSTQRGYFLAAAANPNKHIHIVTSSHQKLSSWVPKVPALVLTPDHVLEIAKMRLIKPL